jgi:hypothetical protein
VAAIESVDEIGGAQLQAIVKLQHSPAACSGSTSRAVA